MDRRQFVSMAGLGLLATPLAARAQQAAKVPTIGVLVIGNIDPAQFWRLFRQGLHDLGYVEGQNIIMEYRPQGGKPAPLSWCGSRWRSS